MCFLEVKDAILTIQSLNHTFLNEELLEFIQSQIVRNSHYMDEPLCTVKAAIRQDAFLQEQVYLLLLFLLLQLSGAIHQA